MVSFVRNATIFTIYKEKCCTRFRGYQKNFFVEDDRALAVLGRASVNYTYENLESQEEGRYKAFLFKSEVFELVMPFLILVVLRKRSDCD